MSSYIAYMDPMGTVVLCFFPHFSTMAEVFFPMGFAPVGIREIQRFGNAGGDPGKVVLLGNSAGAHLASLLALDASTASTVPVAPALRGAGDSPHGEDVMGKSVG